MAISPRLATRMREIGRWGGAMSIAMLFCIECILVAASWSIIYNPNHRIIECMERLIDAARVYHPSAEALLRILLLDVKRGDPESLPPDQQL